MFPYYHWQPLYTSMKSQSSTLTKQSMMCCSSFAITEPALTWTETGTNPVLSKPGGSLPPAQSSLPDTRHLEAQVGVEGARGMESLRCDSTFLLLGDFPWVWSVTGTLAVPLLPL